MNNKAIIHVGFGNIVLANRIVAVISPESAPMKRVISEARERHTLIDATHGRRTRAVILTDSDYIILSSLQPETIAGRLNQKDGGLARQSQDDSNDEEPEQTEDQS